MPRAMPFAAASSGALASLALASCASEISLTSKPEATASAGITGGVLGGAIGTALDERDRQRAYAAEVQALEYGEPGDSGRLARGGPEALRHGDPRRALPDPRCQMPRLFPQHLYRRPTADRARHRLPQPGRKLDARGVTVGSAIDPKRLLNGPLLVLPLGKWVSDGA